MEMEDGKKSYLISALRQQKQNENYVISSPTRRRSRAKKKKEESYLDRCGKPMLLSFILVLEQKTQWNYGHHRNHPQNKWKPVTNF